MTDEACTEAGAAEGRRRVKQEAAHGRDFSKDVGLHCGVGLGLVDDFDGDGGVVDEGLDGGGQGSCDGDLAIAVAIEAFEDLSGLLGDEAALVDASRHVPSKPPGNRPEARPQGSPEVCSGDRRSEEASPLQAGNGGAERDQEVPEEHGAPDPQAAIPKAGEGENANWASWAWRSFNGSDFRASTVLLVDPNPPNEPESKPESPRSEESVREVKTKESEKTKTTATATAMAMAIL
ncbi:hypothetical protein ACFX1X_027064 [Malus domestica]